MEQIADIVELQTPELNLPELREEPVRVKGEWGAYCNARRELESALLDMKTAKVEWFEMLKKLTEANRILGETDFSDFIKQKDLAVVIRKLTYKIRDMKKAEKEWEVVEAFYDRELKNGEVDINQALINQQNEASRTAMEALAKAITDMGKKADADFDAPSSRGFAFPAIQMPKLKGGKDWLEFWEQYETGIHGDTRSEERRVGKECRN